MPPPPGKGNKTPRDPQPDTVMGNKLESNVVEAVKDLDLSKESSTDPRAEI